MSNDDKEDVDEKLSEQREKSSDMKTTKFSLSMHESFEFRLDYTSFLLRKENYSLLFIPSIYFV